MNGSNARVRAVIRAFHTASGTPSQRLRTAIGVVAQVEGLNRSRIHKTVVHDRGYKGRGAQDRAAADMHAGTYPGMEQATPETSPETETTPETVVAKPAPPKTNPTRVWLEQALAERNLVQRVTRIVHRRYPIEDVEDVQGKVHEMIGYWADRGSFDAELEKGNPPSATRLAAWVANRIKGDLNKRGRDGLWRVMRGSRTLSEYRSGETDAVTSDDAYEAHSIVGDDEQVIGMEVVDPTPNVEQRHAESGLSRDEVTAALRNAITAAHPNAASRYLQVLEDVVAHQEEAGGVINEREQCSDRRAAKLIGRVREDIRQAAWSTVAHARAILRELVREPFSTRAELIAELRIPSGDLDRAVRMLIASGYVTDFGDRSYLATDAGRTALEAPISEGVAGRLMI